jgi:hypothetical protein
VRATPLQNRCAPDGTLHAVPERGLLMGNRGGRLHRPDGTLGAARWKSRAWICCLLAFRGRHRGVMGDGYTEVFFLDEATALAAGHRPCFECRRAAARAFAAAWPAETPPRAAGMDLVLHAERRAPPATVPFAALPEGSVFLVGDAPHLAWSGRAWRWSFAGYAAARRPAPAEPVVALTPPSVRATLAAGYAPMVHPSAA